MVDETIDRREVDWKILWVPTIYIVGFLLLEIFALRMLAMELSADNISSMINYRLRLS